jgi:hypothetical protein
MPINRTLSGDSIKVLGQAVPPRRNVKDRDLLDTTGLTPAEGDSYLMPASGTILGAWATAGVLNNEIAAFARGGWRRITPTAGVEVFVEDEEVALEYATGGWRISGGSRAAAPLTTLAALDAIGNAINTTGKFDGKLVKVARGDALGHRYYFAQGAAAGAIWTPEDGQAGLGDDRTPV